MDIQPNPSRDAQVRDFLVRHRVGLLTLLFTDIVGSVDLKKNLGDYQAVLNIQGHHALVREVLRGFKEGEEIETAGDSFLLIFAKPSDAVKFALVLQSRLRALAAASGVAIHDRIGIHLGEVFIEESSGPAGEKSLFGIQVDTAARVMSLAGAGQTVMTRAVFDSARQVLKGQDLPGLSELLWMNHGPYLLKGIEGSVDICEAGEVGQAPLQPPVDSEKAHRHLSADSEPVLGWRPALGQTVPHTQWSLTEKLGEGGFGEVWLARHKSVNEARVFKFCFRADHVRSLKRELTLFQLLKHRVGDHPHIVRLMDLYFEKPPFYLEMEYVPGRDLATWAAEQGGLAQVPLATRLEIVAQVADALQAAHDCGIIHRDIKPSNILISNIASPGSQLTVKLTDFGIGQIVSADALGGLGKAGFTVTMLDPASGTRLYMAPELLTNQKATPRSDIYSLGIVLYQLATTNLARPLTTDWARQIADPLLRADLEQCFAGDPQERFASVSLLAKNLRALPARRAERARQQAEQTARERAAYRRGVARTAALGAVVVVLLIGLTLFAWNQAVRAKAAQAKMLAEMQDRLVTVANDEVTKGYACAALPMLAKILRDNPANRLAANRLLNLTQAEWPVLPGDEKNTAGPFQLGREASPDGGRKLAIKGILVELLDARTGQPIGEALKHPSEVLSAQFSPDGQRVLTAAVDGLRVWDAFTRQSLGEPFPRSSKPALFSRDGRLVILGAEDNSPRGWEVWDARAGLPISDSLRQARSVQNAQFSPDGQRVITVSWDKSARVWDALTGLPTGEILRHAESLRSAHFSPDGQRVVTASDDFTARLWDAHTGQPLGEPMKHDKSVKSAQFSPDGQRVVTASADTTARFWDAHTGRAAGTPLLHTIAVRNAQFSPNGQLVATLTDDWTVSIWDARTGQLLGKPVKHTGVIASAQFSPDSQLVVTASDDFTAGLWNARAGQPLGEPFKHAESVKSARFSPDGRFVVTASADTTARLWDVRTGRPVSDALKHAGVVASAQFSPDGQRVVTASYDTTARVWDVRTGQPISEPLKHASGVENAQFSPDGQRVLTTAADGTTRLWDVPVAPETTPAWLPVLAEAVAGQRLDARRLLDPVPPAEFLQLREQLLRTPDAEPLGRWVKWFLGDRQTRAISPFSGITVPEYVRRRLAENTLESLRDATRLNPTHGPAYARLAHAVLTADPEKNPRTIAEADFLSRYALQWSPDDPEVKRLRAEIAAAVKSPTPK